MLPGSESNNPYTWTDANSKSVTRRRRHRRRRVPGRCNCNLSESMHSENDHAFSTVANYFTGLLTLPSRSSHKTANYGSNLRLQMIIPTFAFIIITFSTFRKLGENCFQ